MECGAADAALNRAAIGIPAANRNEPSAATTECGGCDAAFTQAEILCGHESPVERRCAIMECGAADAALYFPHGLQSCITVR